MMRLISYHTVSDSKPCVWFAIWRFRAQGFRFFRVLGFKGSSVSHPNGKESSAYTRGSSSTKRQNTKWIRISWGCLLVSACAGRCMFGAVSFHNFKSQNFKLSVSNPKSKYVDYLSVLSQISNCQGLGRKNKHEILKTDRAIWHMSGSVKNTCFIFVYLFSRRTRFAAHESEHNVRREIADRRLGTTCRTHVL